MIKIINYLIKAGIKFSGFFNKKIMELTDKVIAEKIEKIFDNKEYAFFKGPLSVNVFAIRCELNTNEYDDIVGVVYYDETKNLVLNTFKGTTEPGKFWLENPMRSEGCAIMVEGQYRGAYRIGPHGRNKYEACRQNKPISVYRDNNEDTKHDLDPSTIQTGVFYTNIHHGYSAEKVNKNSAGCIVIQSKKDFEEQFMPIIKKSVNLYGKDFTFTLLNKTDFA